MVATMAIRANAAQITSHAEKQTFLKAIYEGFYKVYNPKAADRLGVVYTPNEIVRFMIEGADWLCHKHFGKNLIDHGVEILDPATGTGTFICELLDYFRGQPDKLRHKYKEELHANEVAILPYYVANLNIEATYAAVAGQYAEFPNLCFVDTLDNVAGLGIKAGYQHDLFAGLSDENVERVKRQNKRKISVIIGNPPYNANQQNENDNNKNRAYPRIDDLIKRSFVKLSTAQKTKVYDMYARFFRWSFDRLHDDGIIAFITNRSFIDSRTFDGFRRFVAAEFAEVYVVDLGGDVRANPKPSGTKHNVFQSSLLVSSLYRPFTVRPTYFSPDLNEDLYQLSHVVGRGNNPTMLLSGYPSAKPFQILATDGLWHHDTLDKTNGFPRVRLTAAGDPIDNITDWALNKFEAHYGKAAKITKDDIFAYVYGVLHDPVYRQTYAQNLKRELPRIPLYPDFRQWAGWGKRLMDLHIGYEAVDPWPLTRTDTPDQKARAAGVSPKVILKSDPATGTITLDSETTLTGIPTEAWDYRLGNRSALDWILDQHKEKTPKDPTIRERFNTYRFADHKEKVVDLIARVARVSVETTQIVQAMTGARREAPAD